MRTFVRWWVASWLSVGCAGDDDHGDGAPGTFACGDNGGTCDVATEVCIVGGPDMCSSCVPKPDACDAEATCDCLPPGTDPVWGAYVCVDAGVCGEADGGLVLTCAEITWGCG